MEYSQLITWSSRHRQISEKYKEIHNHQNIKPLGFVFHGYES